MAYDNNCSYYSLFFTNDSTGFITGYCSPDNFILRTSDYGVTWTVVYSEEANYFYDVYFPSDSVGYVSTYGNILKTIDGGYTWFYPNPDSEWLQFKSIVFEDNEIGFGCFGNGGLFFAKTTDGGYSWNEQEEFGGISLLKVDSCAIKMLSGDILSSTNCAESWEPEVFSFDGRSPIEFTYSPTDTSALICGIGLNEETWQNFGFVASRNGLLGDWQIQDLNEIYALRSIVFVNQSTAYCVGQPWYPNQYSFLKTTDSGETWNYQEYEFTCSECYSPEIRDVYCPSENVCYAVSGGGGIWRTLNGGGEMFPLPVSVQELVMSDVEIFPNPSSDFITLETKPFLNQNASIEILNSIGQTKLTTTWSAGEKKKQIQIEQLPVGMYFVSIATESESHNLKFVKE